MACRYDYEDLPDTIRRHGLSVSDSVAAELLSSAIRLLHLVDKIDVTTIEAADLNKPVDDVEIVEAREGLRCALQDWEDNR